MKIIPIDHFVLVEEVHPDDSSDTQTYALHYYEDRVYEIDDDRGRDLIERERATKADDDAEAEEPWDTRTATEEEAEAYQRGRIKRTRAAHGDSLNLDVQDAASGAATDF
jgi:hypothetical protein